MAEFLLAPGDPEHRIVTILDALNPGELKAIWQAWLRRSRTLWENVIYYGATGVAFNTIDDDDFWFALRKMGDDIQPFYNKQQALSWLSGYDVEIPDEFLVYEPKPIINVREAVRQRYGMT